MVYLVPTLPPRHQVVKGRRTRASKELPLSIASTIYRQAAGSSTSAGIRTTFEAARAGANSSFRSASGIKPQHQARASSSSRSASTRSASRLLKTNLPFNLRPTEVNMFTLIRSYRQSQNCQPQRSEQVSARLKRFVKATHNFSHLMMSSATAYVQLGSFLWVRLHDHGRDKGSHTLEHHLPPLPPTKEPPARTATDKQLCKQRSE